MKQKTFKTLEFDTILDMLAQHAMSDDAKQKCIQLEPYMDEAEVIRKMDETTQAKAIIANFGAPPTVSMSKLNSVLDQLKHGAMLSPHLLSDVSSFLKSCTRMKGYLKKAESTATDIAVYGNSIYDLSDTRYEIDNAIADGYVRDSASSTLKDIRRKMIRIEEQIKNKLSAILRNNSHCFSESFVSNRNGHFTLVVRKEYKNQIKGSVIDISNSKGSYFIEPESVEKLQKEMHLLHLEEENEIVRILYTLTGLVDDNLTNIKINIEAMHTLDFVFAKAKLSIAMSATPATITIDRKMNITQGRHPLINQDEVIPLDFKLGSDNKKSTTHGIIITGPNTGGKTVVIKTVGLFSVMSQCGLHIPAKEATICMHNMVLCDIGDGQSITENLSTFSSHMTNIIEILSIADMHSLVLLDELGSGTDPTEGMGLATVILEELNKKKCMLVATTHYPEIKEFAHNTPGFINAKMAFDRQNMLPLYQLEIGEAGESCALYIAKRLGLPQQMISRAYAVAYHESKQQKKSISIAHDDFDIISERDMTTQKKVPKIIAKRIQPVAQKAIESKFTVGDSVRVFPSKQIGIVYQKADIKGDVGVRIREKNHLVNHKRIKLVVSAKELYPDNYDMDVVLDTKDNRKAKKKIARKGHNPDLVINIKQGYDSKD